jgi:hypothetical protein
MKISPAATLVYPSLRNVGGTGLVASRGAMTQVALLTYEHLSDHPPEMSEQSREFFPTPANLKDGSIRPFRASAREQVNRTSSLGAARREVSNFAQSHAPTNGIWDTWGVSG